MYWQYEELMVAIAVEIIHWMCPQSDTMTLCQPWQQSHKFWILNPDNMIKYKAGQWKTYFDRNITFCQRILTHVSACTWSIGFSPLFQTSSPLLNLCGALKRKLLAITSPPAPLNPSDLWPPGVSSLREARCLDGGVGDWRLQWASGNPS